MTLAGGVVPFLIDWGKTPHPSESAAKGVTLVGLRAEHPEPDRVAAMLKKLRIPLAVSVGQRPALIAIVESPRGKVDIR
jgi:hypothetical protein